MVIGHMLQYVATYQDIETPAGNLRHLADIQAEIDISAVEIGRDIFGGSGLNLCAQGALRCKVQDAFSGDNGLKAKVVQVFKRSSQKSVTHLAAA